jgi:transposase InsO family protein
VRCSQRYDLGRAWSPRTLCSANSLRFFVGRILGRGFGPSTVRSGSSSPAYGHGGRIRSRSCDLPLCSHGIGVASHGSGRESRGGLAGPHSPRRSCASSNGSRATPLWSRRRIAHELAKLGHCVDKATVAKYMAKPAERPRRPPSQTWKTFVRNHLAGTIAIDFLTVPTVTFDIVYMFFVLSLERRRVLHVNVTAHPYAAWAAQQIVEAIGAEIVRERLIRDRDAIFGAAFDARVDNLGVRQIRIAPRSPWQNGYAERWVGTLRRELLDHVIVLGERHLLRLVRQHVAYYNEDRPHMALRGDARVARAVEPPSAREVVALPRVGGLHHRYSRAA